MKSTGIVRKVDELGRIVLPIELRRTLNIAVKDSLEIYVDGPQIVLKNMNRTASFAATPRTLFNSKAKISAATACTNCLNRTNPFYLIFS